MSPYSSASAAGAVESLADACISHLWLSVPMAVILISIVVVNLCQIAQKLASLITQALKRNSRGAVKTLGAIFIGLVILTIGTARLIIEASSPKPVITSKAGKLLSHDYMLQWEYPDGHSGQTQYRVFVTDKATGKTSMSSTWLPFERVIGEGRLGIWVEAVPPESSRARSGEVELELYDSSLERIKATEELVVAVHADTDSNEGLFCYNAGRGYEGFDVDLINSIVERIKAKYGLHELRVRLVFEPWPDIIEKPNAYEVDMAIASISITSDRQKTVLFSNPYWRTQVAILLPRPPLKTKEMLGLDDLRKLRVGVHQGTTEVDLASKLKDALKDDIQIVQAHNNLELFSMLSHEEVDAVLYDYDRTHTERRNHPGWVVLKIDYDDLQRHNVGVKPEEYGIAFAHVNLQLCKDVNAALEEIPVSQLMAHRIARFDVR
jgi:glutamine transport system substrate-binding protein